MTTLKDIMDELNSKKDVFIKELVKDAVTSLTKTAENTKSEKHAQEIVKAVQELAKENQKYQDIIIGTNTAESGEPEIIILNKTDFKNNNYSISDKIPLVFEVKNVKNYACAIFLHQKLSSTSQILVYGTHFKPKVNSWIIIDKMLNKQKKSIAPGNYSVVVALYNLNKSEIKNSKGNKVFDIVDINLVFQTTPLNNTGPYVNIISPVSGANINKNAPIGFEFETNLKVPFAFEIQMPGNGGIIYSDNSNKQVVKGIIPPIKLKSVKNQKMHIHIHYPNTGSSTVIATGTTNVNII
ncbi:MAG: hypothetical protein ACP5NV_06770 [Candidatus Woesearchaeota archaeon]